MKDSTNADLDFILGTLLKVSRTFLSIEYVAKAFLIPNDPASVNYPYYEYQYED